jgi:NADH:ubiquinone oxidoreductase subunit K
MCVFFAFAVADDYKKRTFAAVSSEVFLKLLLVFVDNFSIWVFRSLSFFFFFFWHKCRIILIHSLQKKTRDCIFLGLSLGSSLFLNQDLLDLGTRLWVLCFPCVVFSRPVFVFTLSIQLILCVLLVVASAQQTVTTTTMPLWFLICLPVAAVVSLAGVALLIAFCVTRRKSASDYQLMETDSGSRGYALLAVGLVLLIVGLGGVGTVLGLALAPSSPVSAGIAGGRTKKKLAN